VTASPARFDAFIEKVSEPAAALTLPPATMKLPDTAWVAAVGARHGIEILAPPGVLPGA
jgi:hypothetical protein